ncbi:hypothetical protein JTB14_007354 [Gonioctena quinquepunctata]|nr:hypothetical protein JTB14_007354 [Gonioctena quinquepunctata]
MMYICYLLALTCLASCTDRIWAIAENSQQSQFSKNPIIPSRSSCGFQEYNTISAGEAIDLKEFPWLALLQYLHSSGEKKWSCAGSLISPKYILTAATCVTGDISRVGKLISVRLGEYDTETDIDCESPEDCNDRPVDVEIEEVSVHPGFNRSSFNKNNAIALVKLKKSVNYTGYIQPICLPEPNESAADEDRVTLAGWNRTNGLVKRKVQVPIVNKKKCQERYSKANIVLADSQLCAGGENGKDACNGDGGGPLMKTTEQNASQWYQEGIVLFGFSPCGLADSPSVYTKIEGENVMENLIQFASHVNSLVSTIHSSRYDALLQNPNVLRMMVLKLPDMLKLRWGREFCYNT